MEWIRRVTRLTDAVQEIRKMDPGIGGYKLWLMMRSMFPDEWIPGRDSFFRILHTFGLTPKRARARHTTNSNHRFHKYSNLIKGFIPTRANQLWVSDITYIELADGCCYLHLVTDAYSHKIIGWCLSETLHAVHTLAALEMAIAATGLKDLKGLIHHSDRGVQYCCDAYIDLLKRYHIQISMTEDYKPTDNAIAERVNGIIKTEVIYREARFKSREEAQMRISGFIQFYNEKRPHSSIGMKTPDAAHLEVGLQKRCW